MDALDHNDKAIRLGPTCGVQGKACVQHFPGTR